MGEEGAEEGGTAKRLERGAGSYNLPSTLGAGPPAVLRGSYVSEIESRQKCQMELLKMVGVGPGACSKLCRRCMLAVVARSCERTPWHMTWLVSVRHVVCKSRKHDAYQKLEFGGAQGKHLKGHLGHGLNRDGASF